MTALYKKLQKRNSFIALDLNENKFKKNINLNKINPVTLSKYPDYKSYRKKFAKYYKTTSKNFIFTNGADEAIKLIFESLLNNDDNILIPSPFFSIYRSISNLYNLNLIEVDYKANLEFPEEKFLKKIKNSKNNLDAVVLINPNNPTGTLLKSKEIENIIKLAENTYVIVDQTYIDFTNESVINLIDKYKNLIIINSFSKLFGLAGLRLGMIFANVVILNNIKRFRLPYNVNSLALELGIDLLSDNNYKQNMLTKYRKEKSYLYRNFEKMNINYYKTNTNFVLIEENDPKRLVSYMKKNGVLIKFIQNENFKNLVRITVGNREENKTFLKLLDKYKRKKYIIIDKSVFLYSKKFLNRIKIILYKLTESELAINEIKKVIINSGPASARELINIFLNNSGIKSENIRNQLKKLDEESIIKNEIKRKMEVLKFLKEKYLLGFLGEFDNTEIPKIFDSSFNYNSLPNNKYIFISSNSNINENNHILYYNFNLPVFNLINFNDKTKLITNLAEGADMYEKINN